MNNSPHPRQRQKSQVPMQKQKIEEGFFPDRKQGWICPRDSEDVHYSGNWVEVGATKTKKYYEDKMCSECGFECKGPIEVTIKVER